MGSSEMMVPQDYLVFSLSFTFALFFVVEKQKRLCVAGWAFLYISQQSKKYIYVSVMLFPSPLFVQE